MYIFVSYIYSWYRWFLDQNRSSWCFFFVWLSDLCRGRHEFMVDNEKAIFQSPLYPKDVPAERGLNCEWTLTAPQGGYYKINFIDAYTNDIGELKVNVGGEFMWKFRGTNGVRSLATPMNTTNITVGYTSSSVQTTGSFMVQVQWRQIVNS